MVAAAGSEKALRHYITNFPQGNDQNPLPPVELVARVDLYEHRAACERAGVEILLERPVGDHSVEIHCRWPEGTQ